MARDTTYALGEALARLVLVVDQGRKVNERAFVIAHDRLEQALDAYVAERVDARLEELNRQRP